MSKGKILVVDDDRLVLATVVHGLVQAGFEVIDADNGDDAILQARAHRPDLALLDIRMEGKSGFDVADYLRESLGTPFMFLSAFADSATVARVKELGAVAYLVKPLDIAQIVPTVEAAVASVRARRDRDAPVPAVPSVAPPPVAAPAAVVTCPERPAAPLDVIALAVGVLMHRYSLQRAEALQRLQRLAHTDGRSLSVQATALLDAVELLSRPGAD
jgi:two-component system, response regulator PdtaR